MPSRSEPLYCEQTGNSERENARNRECGAISFMLHKVAICFAAICAGSAGTEPVRHLKIGSVIVREYEGKLHEVKVASGGFSWPGQTYSSLSTIARKITGTSWNGPRFFGLRGKDKPPPAEQEVKSTGLGKDERRPSRGAVRPRFKGASADGGRPSGKLGPHETYRAIMSK